MSAFALVTVSLDKYHYRCCSFFSNSLRMCSHRACFSVRAVALQVYNHFDSRPSLFLPSSPFTALPDPHNRFHRLYSFQSIPTIEILSALLLLVISNSRHHNFFIPRPSIKSSTRHIVLMMPGFRKFIAQLLCGHRAVSKEEPAAPARPVISQPFNFVGSLPRGVTDAEEWEWEQPKPMARQTSSVYSRPTASPSCSSIRTCVPPSSVTSDSSAEDSEWELARVRERIEQLQRLNSGRSRPLRRISEDSGHRAGWSSGARRMLEEAFGVVSQQWVPFDSSS